MDAESAPASQAATQTPTNAKAVAALVLGILGVTLFPLVPSIIAVVVGGQAKREAQGQGLPGDSLAHVGVVLGWIGIVLSVLFLVFVVPLMFGIASFLSGP